MRTSYVQDPVTHELVPKDEYYRRYDVNAPMVMPDIQPYQSMIDGSLIQSRSQHRSHLREHRCIEIGNETKALFAQGKPKGPPPGLKDEIIRAFHKRGL